MLVVADSMTGRSGSDHAHLLAPSKFLVDRRRLPRSCKMILVAPRSIFQPFLTDEEQFANLQLWKNLLRMRGEKLWEGEITGQRVQTWGLGCVRPTDLARLGW